MKSPHPGSLSAAPANPPVDARAETIAADEPRNLLVLAVHYIVLRIAWIFKTESVIMPAFVDAIAGAGWIRGCLPVISRFGQSIPPLFFADRLRRTRYKKRPLLLMSVLMGFPFLTIAALWFSFDRTPQPWLPGVFLFLYTLFSVVTGLHVLSFGTVQGKLIRPNRRGRLLSISGIGGSVLAIVFAWFLLQYWLGLPDRGFGHIFAFTGVGFIIAGLIGLAVREPADAPAAARDGRSSIGDYFHTAWTVFRDDARFRQAAIVAMLFISIQHLFPHFQALGRERLNTGSFDLMVWIVVQNAGVGVFSYLSGTIADRVGNRLAVRVQVLLVALTPLIALAAVHLQPWGGQTLFRSAFFLLGLTPVTMRTFVNYTLELADEHDHPRYVSTMSVCMAVPFLFSPLIGLLVDLLDFEIVFVSITGVVLLGGLWSYRMAEPRDEVMSGK